MILLDQIARVFIPHRTSTDRLCYGFRIQCRRLVMSDHLEIRCPKLGGEVTFAYCLIEGGDLPCSRTIVCWQQYLPVETHLRAKLTPEQWDRCFSQTPKEKMVSLVELMEEAKKRQEK